MFFGLQEKPFNVTPDPRFLFLSQSHQEALSHLLYGIEDRKGFIAITGEVGTGKTLLCRALLDRLRRDVRTALILNSFMSEIDLLRSINEDFGIPSTGTTRKELIDTLNTFLLDEFRAGRNAVLIIDEAQNLAPAVLEQIRMLSNLETERGKLLQIVLVGQPELRHQLARPELRQLNQRIALRYHVRPFDRRETSDYINHRLLVAGSHGGVGFTPRALRAIFHCSHGIARTINLLCDRALLLAYVQGTPRIAQSLVHQANAELSATERRWSSRFMAMRLRRAFLIGQGVFIALALTGGGAWFGYHRPKNLEIAGLVFGTTPPPPAHQLALPAAEDGSGDALGQEAVPVEAAPQVPWPTQADPPEAIPVALEPESVENLVATLPVSPMAAATQDSMPGGLEGSTLLRTVLWEYYRMHPQQRIEGVRALLASAAGNFGLEMMAIRTNLQHLKKFRLACLVETALPPVGAPTLSILHTSTPERVAVMEASGEVRQFTEEEFVRMWTGRAYLFHREGQAVRNILVRGQQGAEVQALQQRLGQLGYLAGEPSGIFDGATDEAVRRFQRDLSLQIDGAAGPATKMMLSHLVGGPLHDVGQP
jgi:general secretion pathway protein A